MTDFSSAEAVSTTIEQSSLKAWEVTAQACAVAEPATEQIMTSPRPGEDPAATVTLMA